VGIASTKPAASRYVPAEIALSEILGRIASLPTLLMSRSATILSDRQENSQVTKSRPRAEHEQGEQNYKDHGHSRDRPHH